MTDFRTPFEREFDAGLAIGLGAAASLLPSGNGKAYHPTTVWRWTTKGYRGLKLEAVQTVGGKLLTTGGAVRRFLAAVAQLEAGQDVTSDPEADRLIDAELDALGV